jgi:hypothetical protein
MDDKEKIIGVDDDGMLIMQKTLSEKGERIWLGVGGITDETATTKMRGLVFYTPLGFYYLKLRRNKKK